MRIRFLLVGGLICLIGSMYQADGADKPTSMPSATTMPVSDLPPQQVEFFESKIRPLLTNKCFKCHSVEQGKSKGELVLDSREGLRKGGENGAIIVPGNPAKSMMIKAISYTDPDLQMPPKGDKLSPQEIADLTQWISMGAPDPRVSPTGVKLTGLNDKARAHWAYQPVTQPSVPEVKNKAWVRTPVDNFILAKLEANDMTPSHQSPKATLLRRATYDLTGLPPTPQELRMFEADSSPQAFEKVVDRLLASPHYGERWGRFWLDTARYSDTTGNDDSRREEYRLAYAWTYRDWVINSINNDMPYNEFLKEQIAADLLPADESDPDQLAALGFLTIGKRYPNVNDTIDERIDTLGKATMGLTIACARCHDHKFDPIPTADYYSLHGVFSSIIEPEKKPVVGHMPTDAERADYQKKLADLEQKDRDLYYQLITENSAKFRKKSSAYLLSAIYTMQDTKESMDLREKLMESQELDQRMVQFLNPRRHRDEPLFAVLFRFANIPADQFAQKSQEIVDDIAADAKGKQFLHPAVTAAFAKIKPGSLKNIEAVADVYGKVFDNLDQKSAACIAGYKSGKPDNSLDATLLCCPFKIEPAAALTTDHLREIANTLALGNDPYDRFYFGAINELQLTNPGDPGRAMIVADAAKPVDSPIFIHGDAGNRGAVVPRRFLQILSGPNRQPFKVGSGRLELAEDIASKNNPLTARVLVNRVWMHHFGEGFIRTPDDLGVQSEPPSHPELLDYLASRFMEEGWSLKKLHKEIMLSAAYQQSSDTNIVFAKKDPENRLLWHANLRRLDFEAFRDSLVQFTGHMDTSVGGRSVNLTDEPYSLRRSVYGYIDRSHVPDLLSEFDFPDPNRANSKRTQHNRSPAGDVPYE